VDLNLSHPGARRRAQLSDPLSLERIRPAQSLSRNNPPEHLHWLICYSWIYYVVIGVVCALGSIAQLSIILQCFDTASFTLPDRDQYPYSMRIVTMSGSDTNTLNWRSLYDATAAAQRPLWTNSDWTSLQAFHIQSSRFLLIPTLSLPELYSPSSIAYTVCIISSKSSMKKSAKRLLSMYQSRTQWGRWWQSTGRSVVCLG